jgi:hypothetical protein
MSNIKNLPILPRKKDEDYPIKIFAGFTNQTY